LEDLDMREPLAQLPEAARPLRDAPPRDTLSVVETTELRWFVPGPLPSVIDEWFTGSTGVHEERCDTYLLEGRSDMGVKRRFRETLELKVRQSLDGRIDLGEGFGGPLEVWRKWSPAEGIVAERTDGRWVDVRKSVVKRRFSLDGTEVEFSQNAPATGSGCDVEVAGVAVGAVDVWTFAFAAFGPNATRRDALLASWQALITSVPCPELLSLRTGRVMGYPEWLALAVPLDPIGNGAHHLSATPSR